MICKWRFLATASLLALAAGCSQTGGRADDPAAGIGTRSLPGGAEQELPAPSRPDYQSARTLADSVKVGMPQQQVEAMFGTPDKAGYRVYGRATEQAWRALVWEWVFRDVTPPRALSIVFQEDAAGTWRVNHGDWPE